MKRLLALSTMLLVSAGLGVRATSLYVSPDVPTDESASGTTILPWRISVYDARVPAYAAAFPVAGDAAVDAIHKLEAPGGWLFSLEAASNLGGALATEAESRDVILYDRATSTYSLCFSGAAAGVPFDANVDALYLEGGDSGNLVVSFDVPVDLGGFATFDPADLVRFVPTAAGICAGWALSAVNPAFDASAAGIGIPTSSNLIGADVAEGALVLSFDVPTDLGPPGAVTYLPGQLVSWDGASFSLFEALPGWPIGSEVDGVSLAPDPPGSIGRTLLVAKSTLVAGDLTLTWGPSCSTGGTDYGIYEGTIGSWSSHTMIDCVDDAGDLTEEVAPAGGDRYYLVVPHSVHEEGSYGATSSGTARPAGVSACVTPQVVMACPP